MTFTVTDRAGKAPSGAIVSYFNPETGESGEVNLDADGTGTVSLPPGGYDFHSTASSDGEIVFGLTSVAVKDAPVEATANGTKAKAVEYRVDRPVKLHEQSLRPFTVTKDGGSFGNSATFPNQYTGFLIPNPDSGHKVGVEAVPHLVGTDKADPYIYDLNFFQDDGIPAEPVFTAKNEDLAQVEVDYDGYATEEPAAACNNSLREGGAPVAGCHALPVEWQTKRTEYLTPGSDISWQANVNVGAASSDEFVDIEGHYTYAEPGPAERVTANAPLSFNVAGEHEEPVVARDGDKLYAALSFLDNTNPDETFIDFHEIKGTAVLKRDGEEIGRNDMTFETTSFTLPDNDSGTYTLSVELTHPDSYTPLATTTSVQWQFESEPVGKLTPMDVSAVSFDAEGIEGGYADASAPQKFTLDYLAQKGATDTSLEELIFEVSYDDGKTWEEVDVKRDGDSGTGKLKHPSGAKFVSVRATATDDAGNKVTHSTIHTYGLK